MLSSPKTISNVAHVKEYLEKIEVHSCIHGEWDTFWELYKPHKKAGQGILITTADKVAVLEQSGAILIKNLVIIYQGNTDTAVRKVIKNIPCIAYVSDEG